MRGRFSSRLRERLAERSRERGYAAVMVAILVPTVFLGMAALGVDTARWYLEIERVQKAADAAALAGVTYMPADLPAARAKALEVSSKNGYTNGAKGGLTTVTVAQGDAPSELKVTVSTRIDNTFGVYIGTPHARITRSAVADFTAPAPMGSPCNIFGNEPPSQPGAAQPSGTALPASPFPNCTSNPQFWAAIEGPATDKVQGDRYMTKTCVSGSSAGPVYECVAGKNDEFKEEGYFFAVKVEPAAVGTPIDVQIYDPAYVYTSVNCTSLASSGFTNNMNDYTTTDGLARYDNAYSNYCSGDYNPGFGSIGSNPPDTTFVLRGQTETNDPRKATPISGCTKQFRGVATPSANSLKKSSSSYNQEVSRVFHQWVSLCTFTPTAKGDYFLQVRTNVSLGGTPTPNNKSSLSPMVYSGNAAASAVAGNDTTGQGLNSFALRAVPTNTSMRSQVSVSGFSRMPILQNASSSTAQFNLIRALPASRGQYVAFDFYDVADGAGSSGGTVKVIAPADATGSIKASSNVPGCKGALNGGNYTSLSNCTVNVKNTTHDGQVQHMVIPLPNDYNCNPSTLGGCWFRVQITFGGTVTDFTTWDANIGGDPVRLIE